jgi:protein-S-isoprenylcysteine O-methyltransferase Ste14
MSKEAAHKSPWAIAEVIFGIPLLIGIVLQWMVPLSVPQGILRIMFIPAGTIFIVAAIVFVSLARHEFSRYGQPTDPGQATGKILTSGVFSISRNPLYLGAVGFVVGVGLALNFLWILVLLVPALVGCQIVLIAPEEKYLAAKFGEEYQAYAASVHRWLGRRRIPR